MQNLKMIVRGFILLSFVASPFAMAKNTDQLSAVVELERQVNALKAQIAELQSKLATTREEVRTVRQELKLARALEKGSRGDDVRDLQQFLAQFPDVYPEALITGFFGELTEKAIKRFQKKHTIEQAGIVGPKTRSRLLALSLENNGATTTLILPLGLAKKLIRETTDDDDTRKGKDDKKGHDRDNATTTPRSATTTPAERHKLIICHKEKNTIAVSISAWNAHGTHGDTIGACPGGKHDDDDGDDDDGATTMSDTTAPLVTELAATSTATTIATITWATNEPATSKVLYGTSTPVTNANSSMVTNGTLVVMHSLALSGLTASTTYYSLALSMDAAGNTATSTELSFTTL